MQASNPSERLQRLRILLQQDPQNVSLLREAVDCAMQLGLWREANELVERTLAVAPQDRLSHYCRAVLLAQSGQTQESVALTQAMLDADAQHDALLYQHACNLILLGRQADASRLDASAATTASSMAAAAPPTDGSV